MKILHLDTRPDWRGGQHQILMTLRGLRERGHDAQLMTRRGSPLEQRATAERFPVHTFPPRPVRLNAFLCLREILDQQRFDVVHAHDPHALSAAWLARVHWRGALVVSRRVAYPLSRGWPALARYKAAHRVIAVSKFVAKSVTNAGIDANRVGVVYDGVEIPPAVTAEMRSAARRRWKVADDKMLLGCVGYLLPEKGQESLVHAMRIVTAEFSTCKLILAGDGPMRARLELLASELGLRDAILLAGFVQDTESVYRALDAFVFPSLAEPLGSSLLAAMAHGLPAVAVASGGVPEIIESGRNGALVAVPDAAALARAICTVLHEPQTAQRLGAAARETIERRFSVDALAENTLSEYEQAIGAVPAS
jgi:glycosyltransferase involved in cell wall biosynthesis